MICWQMGKTFCKMKTPLGEVKVTTPKNLPINNQAVTSTRNLTTTLAYPKIPIYSWTFAPIPNWTWFCSSLLSFDAQIFNLWLTPLHRSQYVTNSNNLNDCCWLQSSALHQQWRSGSTWLQNLMAYKHSSFSQRKLNSWSEYSYMTALKISLIYVWGCEKRNPKQIYQLGPNFRSGILKS